MSESNHYAVFVTTSDDFFAGTCVALASFLDTNRWFAGDIIVVSDDLSELNAQILSENFTNLRLLEVEPRLKRKAQELKDKFPRLGNRARIFYNLQVFYLNELNRDNSLPRYDRVLKIDSDMLFRGEVKSLFELNSDIAACPARLVYLGKSRSKIDFSVVSIENSTAFDCWVSAGLYSVSGKCLNEANYLELLSFMSIEFWGKQKSNHTDQLCINALFYAQIEVLSPIYNYLLPHQDIIHQYSGVRAKEGLVWHFVGKNKPWLLNQIQEPGNQSATALHLQLKWLNTYKEFRKKCLLRVASKRRQ